MIEGRLKSIIENLLGDWIESDKLDLSINIWKDENVRFDNVNLKESIIPTSAPFRLKVGLIGSLTMNIPFKTFGTTPAKITLNDVLVILSPRNLDEIEKLKEIDTLKSEKLKILEKDILERIHGPQIDKDHIKEELSTDKNKKNSKKNDTSQETQGYYGADGFFGRLITRLMDNLHIEFKNVHIRFEGTDTNRDLSNGPRAASGKYAVGFSIGALYAETTGSNWISKPHNEADPESGNHVVFKLIQANNLSAYVDPHALHFVHSSKHPRILHATLSRLKTMSDFNVDLKWWKQNEYEGHTHRFLLAPFHVTLKLTMNISKADKTNETPHYDATFEFSKLMAMLDEEQIVLINRILDLFVIHDQWRNAIAQRVKADERDHYTTTLNDQYMIHWEELLRLCSKQSKWQIMKKSDTWKQLITLEQLVSIEAAITMRNSAAFDDDHLPMDSDLSRTSLHDLGEVFGIPSPQINIKFQKGDAGLKLYLNENHDIVVHECYAQAKMKSAIKPGLLLIKVDGNPLSNLFEFSTIEEFYSQLNNKMQSTSCVLTFRHPEVKTSQVTPNQLISLVTVSIPYFECRIVSSQLKEIITTGIFQGIHLSILGYGPGWFSFHRYHISSKHFYLQESITTTNQTNCLISSIDQIKTISDDLPVLIINVNFLQVDHPSVILDDISTYANQYGIHLGDLIFIYERTIVVKFLKILNQFLDASFPKIQKPTQPASSTTSSLIVSDVPIRVRYDFSIHSVRFFIHSPLLRYRATRSESVLGGIHPSNRSIFSQLTLHKNRTTTGLQEWLRDAFMLERVVAAVIHLQRFIRGRTIRRYAIPISKPLIPPPIPNDAMNSSSQLDAEHEGYLYLHDYRLGCRQWIPLYFVLEKNGVLRMYRNAICHEDHYIESFLMEQCIDINMKLKDDEIIAPSFSTTMYFIEIKFHQLKILHDEKNKNEMIDISTILLASSQRDIILSWYSTLLSYRDRLFDLTKRIPFKKKIGLRKIMMNFKNSYRGWIFRQDLTLAFRRWHEHFMYLDQYGQLRFYEDNTGKVFIDQEDVENINSIVHVGPVVEILNWELPCKEEKEISCTTRTQWNDSNQLGPGGEGEASFCIEITIDSNKKLNKKKTFLLASYSYDEIADWRYILWEKRLGCKRDESILLLRQKSPISMIGWSTWWRAHLNTRFTNTAKPFQNVRAMYNAMNSWISLYLSQFTGTISIHEPPPSQCSSIEESGAFYFDFRLDKLELRDRRTAKSHCIVYIGDTFLEFERGKLKAVAITSDQLRNKGQFILTGKFRSPNMNDIFHGVNKIGLKLNIELCGCILPHAFQIILIDILNEFSPLLNKNEEINKNESYLKVEEILIEINIGLFEAYIEEKYCIAKFLMEENKFIFNATKENENFNLNINTIALYVMTIENQLRLAQINFFQINYNLIMQNLQREIKINIGQVKFEADGRMKILYQLFEALQLFEDEIEDEIDDDEEDEYQSILIPSPIPSPIPEIPNETMRPRHVRNESGVSIRSQPRSMRGRRSHPRNSEIHQTLSFIQPLLTYQKYLILLQRYNYSYWSNTKDKIIFNCENIIFEMVKRSLSLVALDTYIPVLKLTLCDISCTTNTTTEFKNDFELNSKIIFFARYYNTSLADWEPVIESWQIYLNIMKPLNEIELKKPLIINLKANNRLNINFTEAFVRLMLSVSKHHKNNNLKNKNRIITTNETTERVHIINNLGVPIRLANLNTSNPGILKIEIQDGWNLPNYSRFHNIKMDVILLPWWSPCKTSGLLDSLNYIFHLEYGGANAGVAPKLRINLSRKILDHEHGLQELDDTYRRNSINTPRHSTTSNENWISIGSVELNLAGNLMGKNHIDIKRIKFCQWHRLRDHRGLVTGEILIALDFVPNIPINKISNVQTVASGGSLMVDPFRLGSSDINVRDSTDGDSIMMVKLPESIRNGYVPPLALEVMFGDTFKNLLCPLQRAGKFFIKGEGVLAEVKVAQRDESRRVLMLSSPKQIKNLTNLTLNIGTLSLTECQQFESLDIPQPTRTRSISYPIFLKRDSMIPVNPGRKYSLPLGALYSDIQYGIVLQVLHSKHTKIADLSSLENIIGCHILYLAPINHDDCGYCFFMEISSNIRNVYREEQFDTVSSSTDIISHDSKYQIRLHAGFVFENALPIRIKYKLMIDFSSTYSIQVSEGTLAPGDEIEFYYFHKKANLYLCAPDQASTWTIPIILAKCISQEGITISKNTISKADQPEQRRDTDIISFYSEISNENDIINSKIHLFTTRLDYTVADNGSPRTVIYSSLWIYNYSHVDNLMVRCCENYNRMVICQILKNQSKPRLLDCPELILELNTLNNQEPGKWSERLHVGVVGVQKSITLKGNEKKKFEIGVAIQRPLGQFHRTAQVIISSRYIIINYTGMKFNMASEPNGRGRIIEISPDCIEIPFDYPNDLNLNGKNVCLKAGGGADRNYLNSEKWSGMFSIDNEDEFPLWLPGANINNNLPRVRIKIHTIGATVLIKISKDDPPMLQINNCTDIGVKINQVNESEYIIIPPQTMTTFAWECPDAPRKVLCCMLMEKNLNGKWISPTKSKICDFDSLDREEAVIWEDKRYRVHFAAQVKFNTSSRELLFRKAEYNDFQRNKYNLQIKINAIRRENNNFEKKKAFVSIYTDNDDTQHQITSCVDLKENGIYRFDNEFYFPCKNRPREIFLELYEENIDESSFHIDIEDPLTPHVSPRLSTFQRIPDENDSLNINNLKKKQIGILNIKIPKKMWKEFHTTERKIGELDGSWWNIYSTNNILIGKIQLIIKCNIIYNNIEKNKKKNILYHNNIFIKMELSSIGISFVHNKNRLDIAYFIMQRILLIYENHLNTNEIELSIGNIQMDNQMDQKVILGPRGYKRKQGVSVRLRDRWKECLSRKDRNLYEQFDISMLPVFQLRFLYNDRLNSNSFHIELIQFIIQELEISTDEKFLVHLISIFQGLENFGTKETFDIIIEKKINYFLINNLPIKDGIYIEQLDIETIRILFSFELNGGKYIATLGPSGQRLAQYLPVSNVKDLRLYFSKLLFTHIYDSQNIILDKLYRHYLQQALLVVLQGLYTVTLFVNPFRIVYRLGHGVLEIIRLPARGLASGSPVEFISGAYLGVRSLAMNTISASYETLAGATGAVSSIIKPFLFHPDKKQKFQEEMVNFQRAVMSEVDTFDAAEEQHMTKTIIRVPRHFTGIGLLVEYGPGSLPNEEQSRVDLKAAILIQNWWRRRRLVIALFNKANVLKSNNSTTISKSTWECNLM